MSRLSNTFTAAFPVAQGSRAVTSMLLSSAALGLVGFCLALAQLTAHA